MTGSGRLLPFKISIFSFLKVGFTPESGHQPDLLRLSLIILLSTNLELDLRRINDKAKAADRRGRKATGPCFLREATDDFP